MSLTDAERVSIRRHLGLNSANAALYPWVPTFFAVNDVLGTLSTEAETECRAILTRLTTIETALDGMLGRFKASVVGSITLNKDEPRALRSELHRWRQELSTLLGVPMMRTGTRITVS